MPHFEPQSDMIEQSDMRLERLRVEYTDEELLIELRHRGRLARVEVENIAPDYYVKDGFPVENQIEAAWRDFAYEAAARHVKGTAPTGAKAENVRGDNKTVPAFETGRRVRFAVNYVVDRR